MINHNSSKLALSNDQTFEKSKANYESQSSNKKDTRRIKEPELKKIKSSFLFILDSKDEEPDQIVSYWKEKWAVSNTKWLRSKWEK